MKKLIGIALTCALVLAVFSCKPTTDGGGTPPAPVNAVAPTFTTNLSTDVVIYTVDAEETTLDGTATVTDGGTVRYQWYSNTSNSTENGTAIANETSATYTPPTTAAGTTYYYVVATNEITDNNDGGNKTAAVTSNVATIRVNNKVNAVAPTFTTNLSTDVVTYTVDATASALTVATTATADSGTICYQWYKNDSNSTENGEAIANETSATYTPSTTAAGTTYYYVVATNEIADNNDGGDKTATATSNVATITVNEQVNAVAPSFSNDLVSRTYYFSESATDLDGTATAGSGTISYQWYNNTSNSTENGEAIADATSATYTPPTTVADTFYYYVVATNKIDDNKDGGNKTATATSNVAIIRVNKQENALLPYFVKDLSSDKVTYTIGAESADLVVDARIGGDGMPVSIYQWYKNTINSTENGEQIAGEKAPAFTPPTDTVGTTYYYVVATDKIPDNGDGGLKESSTLSNVAAITVQEQVATPTVHYDGHPLQENNAILFSKGVSFDCATTGVTYSYKFSGDTDFKLLASGVTSVSAIPEGSTSITVKASKTDYADSIEKTVKFRKDYTGSRFTFYEDGTGAYKQVVFLSSGKTHAQAKIEAENYSVTVDGTTYSDWFLPNKNELNEIYEALKKTGKITETATFWSASATEDSNGTPTTTHAWTQSFTDGTQNNSVAVEDTHNAIAIRCYNPTSYTIGDTGPGGGIIFWVGANNAYKEVSDEIGFYTWDEAIEKSQNYSSTTGTGTYSDWYLPNKTELNEVYEALIKDKDQPLIEKIVFIWSSSEVDNSNAWRQYFGNGNQLECEKVIINRYRAIRAFNAVNNY